MGELSSYFIDKIRTLLFTPTDFARNILKESWDVAAYIFGIVYTIHGLLTGFFVSIVAATQMSILKGITVFLLSILLLIVSAFGLVSSILMFSFLIYVGIKLFKGKITFLPIVKIALYANSIWFLYLIIPGILGAIFGQDIQYTPYLFIPIVVILVIGIIHMLYFLFRAVAIHANMSKTYAFISAIVFPVLTSLLFGLIIGSLIRALL